MITAFYFRSKKQKAENKSKIYDAFIELASTMDKLSIAKIGGDIIEVSVNVSSTDQAVKANEILRDAVAEKSGDVDYTRI